MIELLMSSGLFFVLLTCGYFILGQWLQRKSGSPLCNPILMAAVLTILTLMLLGIPNSVYQASCKSFSWLLTPATVALEIPLYEQIRVLKKSLRAILAGVLGGTLASLLCVSLLCHLFSLDGVITVTLLPKSITTAIGIVLSEQAGGIPAITAAVIILTGITGNIFGAMLCRMFRITEPVAQGAAFGTASHVIGTGKANEISPVTGAVSSLSLVVSGILTVLLMPAFLP